jgi:hypothetical protein
MKKAGFLVIVILSACGQRQNVNVQLEARIDSLQQELKHSYKPGFGEFMSAIQVHHAKLWYAGRAENWPLAQFEIDEIKESLEGIKQYNADRQESKSIDMINGPLQGVVRAVEAKDTATFRGAYDALTSTCNQCHKVTQHAFNIICRPTAPPFTNQAFGKER